MKYNKNDIITLDNNQEYIITDVIIVDGSTYLYLINNCEANDEIILLKVITINGIETVVAVSDEKEFDKVFTKLAINNKNTIIEFLNNEDNN